MRLLAPFVLIVALAAPAGAQSTQSTFDLTIRGVRAATLTLAGSEQGATYEARASLRSAGLLSLVKTLSFDAASRGAVSDGRFQPSAYSENVDTGSRQSSADLAYRRGTPEVRRFAPAREPRARDVKAETQGGTIDPMTAIFIGLRDQPRAGLCTTDRFLFDGRRRSRVTLSDPIPAKGGITCSGRYQRIAGFSDGEMAEKTDFPFTVTYAPRGKDLMQATAISMDTLLGRAEMRRR